MEQEAYISMILLILVSVLFLFTFFSADGQDVPDFVCTLYFSGVTPCLGGVFALDGKTGSTIWQHWTQHAVYTVDCGTDLTGDNVKDCLATGKGGVLQVVNGHDGSLVWQLEHESTVRREPQVDVYAGQFIQDVDGDGIQDVLTAHTEDTSNDNTGGSALCGHLVLLSGHDGKLLQKVEMPHGEESYYPPQLLVRLDGEVVVLFGTGGQTTPGGLYIVPLQQLALGDLQQMKVLYKDLFKGVMSPPALADINHDGSEDIIVATFNSTVLAFDGRTYKSLWNFSFPDSETFSVPTPGFFNDDDVPDFLVKYQTGPGSPVYYYTQTTILDGRTGTPLLDKMLIDTAGSQMAGLSISVEGLGNDLFLHWQADCIGHKGAQDTFAFWHGDSVQAQSRADLCNLRFNSTLASQYLTLSQHLPPPGIIIYSSEQRKDVEYRSAVNTTAEVRKYLDEHPDFWENYEGSKLYGKMSSDQYPPEKKDFSIEVVRNGGSNFRHKEDESLLTGDQHKAPGYYYNGGGFSVPNRGRNRNSGMHDFSPVGEGEEVLPAFSSNSEYPDVRKHGTEFQKHPMNNGQWRQQWQNSGSEGAYQNMNPTSQMLDNSVPSHDPDYDMLYDPSSEEGYGGQRDERKVQTDSTKQRVKRESLDVPGIQRFTSAGVLAPTISNSYNDSIDVIFATYWIPPSYDAHVLLGKDLECFRSHSKEMHGKYSEVVHETYESKECEERRLRNNKKYKTLKESASNVDPFNINMGQMTVYRLKLTCQCRNMANSERCSMILPFEKQSWPTATGISGNGYVKSRHE